MIDGVADFEVINVQVYNGYVLHTGHLKYGELEVGKEVISSYDEVRTVARLCRLLSLSESSFVDGP